MSEYYTRFQHNLMKYEISYKGGAGGWPVFTGVTSPAEPGERSVFSDEEIAKGVVQEANKVWGGLDWDINLSSSV